MQVSWIDPDDLRSLLGQLQQPASPVKPAAVELHTLPNENGLGARELGIDEGDLWLPEDFAAPATVSSGPASPAPPSEELFSEALAALVNEQATAQSIDIEPLTPPAEEQASEPENVEESAPPTALAPDQGEQLNRIRERLQAIRERALGAGLIVQARVSSEEATASAPVAPPSVEPTLEQLPMAETPPPVSVEAAATTVEEYGTLSAPPPSVASLESSQPLFEPAPSIEASTPSLEERLKPIESPFALDTSAPEPAMQLPAELSSPHGIEPTFQRPAGSITDRLEGFAAWAGEHFAASNLIIVDDHGDILWGDHAQAGLVVSAMMACKAVMRSSALGASGLATVIEQPISADRLLIIVPCETTYGAVSIAFVRDRALTETDAAVIRAALISVVETVPSSPSSPQIGSAID